MVVALRDLLGNTFRFVRNVRRFGGRFAPHYITIDVEGTFPEFRPAPRALWQRALPFGGDRTLSLQQLREDLDLIAANKRICGIILRVGSVRAELARLQSIHQAILRFRESGKRVLAYVTQMTLPSYFIATTADEIIAPECAIFDLRGLGADVHFAGDALGGIGIHMEVEAAGEFKTAVDQFQRSSMSEAHREMLESILDCQLDQLVTTIASRRRLAPQASLDVINRAPLSATAAKAAGLVDSVLYEDQLVSRLAVDGVCVQPWSSARSRLRLPYRRHSGRCIGVIKVEGSIVLGKARQLPLPVPLVQSQAGSETILRALRRAERSRNVAGILLYVNSPGGSSIASDLIWHEVHRIARGKPIVAYLADLAASGAYNIAVGATCVVAQPGTTTGSIGSIAFKVEAHRLLAKLRVNRSHVGRGRHYQLWNPACSWDEPDRLKVRELVKDAYALFKRRVAEGRRLTDEEVEQRAQGRLWTGKQAHDLELVDELGGFETAVDKVRQLAGVRPDRLAPVIPIQGPKEAMLPQAGDLNASAATALSWLTAATEPGVWAVAPWYPRLRW